MRNAAVHKVQAEADDDPGRTPSGLEPTPPRLANAGAVGVRALIVGEDENTRSALRAILTDAGIEVAEAADEDEACAAASRGDTQVVLVDWSIPGGGLMRVRRLEATDGIAGRIVIVSPHTDPRDQRSALEAGAAAYVSKPLRRELLIDAIERVAQRSVKSHCGGDPSTR